MPYRKIKFATGEFYHIVIKAIDNNLLFKDIDDHYRIIFSIYEFNNTKSTTIQKRRSARARIKREFKKSIEAIEASRGPSSTSYSKWPVDSRDKLVEVLAFCIMPNHLHLLVRQIKDGGIVKFMSKLNTGYGGYFNRKYNRQGHVFQKRYTAVQIKSEEQLKAVFAYIHGNPISLIEPKWKEIGIKNPEKAIKFVENYKWSSYPDYIGKNNFPSVTDRDFILELFGGEEKYKEFFEDWVKYKGKTKEFPEIALE